MLTEAANIQLEIQHANKIDFCFLLDPVKPQRGDFDGVTQENFHFYLQLYLPVVFVNPNLGSIFVFTSYKQFEKFILNNIRRYFIWPLLGRYLAKEPAYSSNFNFIQDHYKRHKKLPQLSCRSFTLKWANNFIYKNIWPYHPVVVQLRNNHVALYRNANIPAWIEFFRHCRDSYPNVRFVIIGRREEIVEEIRSLPNVIYAKDYGTNIEQDLALIQTAMIYYGSSSGPGTIALFSDIPYRIFNHEIANEDMREGDNFIFANANQKVLWGEETADLLISEFAQLYIKEIVDAWKSKQEICDKEFEFTTVPFKKHEVGK
jgi:hypothetical protein